MCMETLEKADPLPKRRYVAGIAFNLKKGIVSEVEDIEAEYDSIETVLAIKGALEKAGCDVELLEADTGIFKKLIETKIDIVFNIAEGICGRGREAQVPAVLNFFRIPFTGSDETTLCIALDKALTKRILSTFKIKTPRYRLIDVEKTGNITVSKNMGLKFPVIVKPNAEGSSKGISDFAVVCDTHELSRLVDENMGKYNQPMLVEEFIQGREFTVAVAGNGEDMVVFPPMEIKYKNADENRGIYSFNVKKNFKRHIEYECPAKIEKHIEEKMTGMARKICGVLKCKDFSRIDFRMSVDSEVYFIEINPLPGLAPGYSDYPMIAEFNGMDYDSLIKTVLNSALKRYGMTPVA